jgi:lipid II:glycine glycyltransferase (peptidoglycan interpeptide bridge formation enzyme)
MLIELYRQFDPVDWKDIVLRLNGNPFHLPDILLLDGSAENLTYLVFKRGGCITGACVGRIVKKSFAKVLALSHGLFLPTVPAFMMDGNIEKNDFYNSLIQFLREYGYKWLEIDSRWGDDFRTLRGIEGVTGGRLIEFTINLERNIDVIYGAMHKKHRKNIKRARENGIEIIQDSSLEGLLELRRLQQLSSERASERGNEYSVQDEKAYRRIYEGIYRSGLGNVFFAKKDNEYIAGLAYLAFGKKAVTVRSGSTRKGYDLFAMYLLKSELIRSLKDRGFQELNIGGVPEEAIESSHPQHGLYDYKRYYGGEEYLRTGIRIEIS